MILLDSNLIIYAAKPEHEGLRIFIEKHAPFVTELSLVEVLGYPRLNAADRAYFGASFDAARLLLTLNRPMTFRSLANASGYDRTARRRGP